MAKAKAAKTAPDKPKKHLAANRRRRRARANPAPSGGGSRANPPIGADITHVLLPGFGAYAATRILARIVYSIVQSRWPSLGKHAAALSGAAAFGTTWFFAHKIKALAPYHDGIVMGSGIAALHGAATCYLPEKYSWLLTDCKPEDVTPVDAPVDPAQVDAGAQAPAASAGDEYSYLEEQAEQRRPRARSRGRAAAAQAPEPEVQLDPDLTNELGGENLADLYTGAFEN